MNKYDYVQSILYSLRDISYRCAFFWIHIQENPDDTDTIDALYDIIQKTLSTIHNADVLSIGTAIAKIHNQEYIQSLETSEDLRHIEAQILSL